MSSSSQFILFQTILLIDYISIHAAIADIGLGGNTNGILADSDGNQGLDGLTLLLTGGLSLARAQLVSVFVAMC